MLDDNLMTKNVSPKDMANAIRALSMDAIQKINSGHPGLPLGAADMATVLFTKYLKFDPQKPDWADRDRFVMSAGHGSMLLYSLGYLLGYPRMTIAEIKRFRRLGSVTAGHPEYCLADGIEATTGPLGQGIAMAVGMALAERKQREKYGEDLVSHYTYVLAGDGCLMEGISYEACALAGHLKLNKMIVLFDDNGISIDGPTSLATSEDQAMRFQACGWNVLKADGHDTAEVGTAIEAAQKSDKPTLIMCKTVIGYGAPQKAGTSAAHGGALGEDEVAGVRKAIGWDHAAFHVPAEIVAAWRDAGTRSEGERKAWEGRFAASPKSGELQALLDGKLADGWEQILIDYKKEFAGSQPAEPTRVSSQNILGLLAGTLPNIIGGSADLTASCLTKPGNAVSITPEDVSGNYIHYGIREHAMSAIMNGLALHGGFIPYGGTFLVFSDYCRPGVRLSAIMGQRVIYVFTHDTITQGPDGPTHQSVEHLMALRAMPNLNFFRPADGVEAAECYELALKCESGPSVVALTREAVPAVRATHTDENLCATGAYELVAADGEAKVTIMATGSEVSVALGARDLLQKDGVPTRVVSMPCFELFDQQDQAFKDKILGKQTLRVSVETGATLGWERYVGENGVVIGMTSFGASGMPDELMDHFGFTPEKVAGRIKAAL